MKKIGKIFLSLALVLAMAIPTLFMAGCDFFDNFFGNTTKADIVLGAVYYNEKELVIIAELPDEDSVDINNPNYIKKALFIEMDNNCLEVYNDDPATFTMACSMSLSFVGAEYSKNDSGAKIEYTFACLNSEMCMVDYTVTVENENQIKVKAECATNTNNSFAEKTFAKLEGYNLITELNKMESDTDDAIELLSSFKTEYNVGDTLELFGVLLGYSIDGAQGFVSVTESMISGFDTSTAGTRTMILTYEGCQLEIEYTVSE